MSKVTHFIVFDKVTGEKLAICPISTPIGYIVEAYERAGWQVSWAWK